MHPGKLDQGIDVDQGARLRQPKIQGRHKALATGKEARLFARQHPENAVGFSLIGRDFGDHAGGRDANRTIERGLALHGVVKPMRGR